MRSDPGKKPRVPGGQTIIDLKSTERVIEQVFTMPNVSWVARIYI